MCSQHQDLCTCGEPILLSTTALASALRVAPRGSSVGMVRRGDKSRMNIMRLEQHYQQQRGFSLIELSLVLVLSSVIVAAIYQTFHTQQKTYQQQNVLALMQQNVRASTFIITRELRSARYDPRQS